MSEPFLLGILLILLLLFSPYLSLLERFSLALGSIFVVFLLGIIILSSPIIFLIGLLLIAASATTTTMGLYFIIFRILSPVALTPLLLFPNNLDIIEGPSHYQ